jgi:hypothetical protein
MKTPPTTSSSEWAEKPKSGARSTEGSIGSLGFRRIVLCSSTYSTSCALVPLSQIKYGFSLLLLRIFKTLSRSCVKRCIFFKFIEVSYFIWVVSVQLLSNIRSEESFQGFLCDRIRWVLNSFGIVNTLFGIFGCWTRNRRRRRISAQCRTSFEG